MAVLAELRATLSELRETSDTTGEVLRPDSPLIVALEKHGCRLVRGDKDWANLSVGKGTDRLTVHWRENLQEFEREPTIEDKRHGGTS